MVLAEALGILGERSELLAAGRKVVGMYSSDSMRSYHNVSHLTDCLGEFESVGELADDAGAVEAAIWFHDAVYVPGAADNEQRSAELAVEVLGRLGVGAERLEEIARLVRATDHQGAPDPRDAKLVCDIDLAVLGKPWAEYSRYAAAVGGEYSMPADQFAAGRAAFLREMLAKKYVYHTEHFRRQYEQTARKNIQLELAELEK